jgi:protein-disulfide isomerase
MSRIDTIASGLVAASAISMAAVFASRSPNAATRSGPEYVPEWREATITDRRAGPTDAPVQVLVFNDLECPFCARFHAIVRATEVRYRGRVATVFLHSPISFHKFALPAARAAECAALQGKFGAMVDVLFQKQDSLATKGWSAFAREAALQNLEKFSTCLQSSSFPRIEQDRQLASRFNVRGTPTVIVNGWRFPDTPDSTTLWNAIDSLLASRSPFPRRKLLGLF